jgi:hypothetical protein
MNEWLSVLLLPGISMVLVFGSIYVKKREEIKLNGIWHRVHLQRKISE